MALRAAEDALADAGLEVGRDVDPSRVAVVVGGVGGLALLTEQVTLYAAKGRLGVSPYLLPGVLPNMAAARIAIKFGIQGYTSSAGTACASGAQSIGDAAAAAARRTRPTWCWPAAARRRCSRPSPPPSPTPGRWRTAGPTRPRPAARSTGAATAWCSARAPACWCWNVPSTPGPAAPSGTPTCSAGAPPPTPTTRPRRGRTARPRPHCMRLALRDAGLQAGDVGYLNAHGTGTKAGDAAELRAIRAVFGEASPPVSSTKGVTGHLLGTSGVIEAAIGIQALQRGLLPPTANLDDPDPEPEVDHIRKARPDGPAARRCCRTPSASAATTSAWCWATPGASAGDSDRRACGRAVPDGAADPPVRGARHRAGPRAARSPAASTPTSARRRSRPGVCAALRADDLITSTHRGHGHVLAKGGDPARMLAELAGRETGLNRGRGGSMHAADFGVGIYGANAIVGAAAAIATGAAWAAPAGRLATGSR